MAGTFRRRPLSGSTHGKKIKITGTATGSSVTLHTANGDTVMVDSVVLYAVNSSNNPCMLTVECGGTADPDDLVSVDIPPKGAQPTPVLVDYVLRNSLVFKAFAEVANVVQVFGYVHTET